jgi:hypothetical protein
MKTENIVQGIVDQIVERTLTLSPDNSGKRPWPPEGKAMIANIPRGHLYYVAHGDITPTDINLRWRELAYLHKRNAGRKYFSAAPEMVLADLSKLPKTTVVPNPAITEDPTKGKVLALERKIAFLEMQLESNRPYLQLYRLGAGSLFVAFLSLAVWLLTGTGIPFHPIFAIGVIPAAIGVIAMAFLIRPESSRKQ